MLCFAVPCCAAAQGERVVSEFVSHLALNPQQEVPHGTQQQQQQQQGAVTISTIHTSKVSDHPAQCWLCWTTGVGFAFSNLGWISAAAAATAAAGGRDHFHHLQIQVQLSARGGDMGCKLGWT
jgi:hypothetical protein